MKDLKFCKITAQGNDYIYIDERSQKIDDDKRQELVKKLSNRRFGVGSDGVVFLQQTEFADIRMKMFNSDGSVGKMCGSALRSVVYLLSKEKEQAEYVVSTDSGIRKGWLTENGTSICVEMGRIIEYTRQNDTAGTYYIVNIGNLHKVWISEILDAIRINSLIEMEQASGGERYNLEFVEVFSSELIKIRIFESGSGFTYACGSGAAASAFVCIMEKKVSGNKIKVKMPGGEVSVEFRDEKLFLTGKVKLIFKGIIEDADSFIITGNSGCE